MLSIFLKQNKICHIVNEILKTSIRKLNLMEFQSKNLLRNNGLTIQKFCLVDSTSGFTHFDEFDVDEYVVKAQILAGGRGKGHFDNGFKGGVKVTKKKSEAKRFANSMLGQRLITKQTPKNGILVKNVMVAESADIVKETYVCIAMDRHCNGPVIMASPEGGVDIESVAKRTPHLLRKIPIDIFQGLTDETAAEISDFLRFKLELRQKVIKELKNLWNFFIKVDALLIEINPLAATKTKDIMCIDAKLNFDDNAKYRQQQIFSIQDLDEHDPNEEEAERYNLNYIKLDGNIGCLVNGAGLAMATMDLIKLFGGAPANFLDIGGSVTPDQIKIAFNILRADKRVQVILVNVFGGIVNCEMIAKGILTVAKDLNIPTVIRLEGTNAEKGRKIISDAHISVVAAKDFADAAQKAVNLVRHREKH